MPIAGHNYRYSEALASYVDEMMTTKVRKPAIHMALIFLVLSTGDVALQDARAGWLFGPDNADECRTDYMAKAGSSLAARLIAKACNDLFGDPDREEWAECILDHAVHTESEIAIKLIAQACSRTASGKDTAADRCMLKKLPGVSVDVAAKQIVSACRD